MRQAGRFGWLLGRLLAVVCLTLGVLGFGAVGALAATPPSLASGGGETLTGVTGSLNGGDCPVVFMATTSYTFSVSGTATGPYPGTFTESGSFTIEKDDPVAGPPPAVLVTAFSARFTIIDSAGRVTGTKTLSGLGDIRCIPFFPGSVLGGRIFLNYTATIDGAYRDTGTSDVLMVGSAGSVFGLSETFGSSNGVVALQNDNGQANNDNQGT